MYKTATFLVNHFWGQPSRMADSLGVLLLTWNQAFYRYGLFDFQQLENCLAANQSTLNLFRSRNIVSYSPDEAPTIRALFDQFLNALRICEGTKKGVSSPVAVAKALHLLAPSFFPLWDAEIAKGYGCRYGNRAAETYISFLLKMKRFAERLQTPIDGQLMEKPLLKLIDEYNYARFTKGWVQASQTEGR